MIESIQPGFDVFGLDADTAFGKVIEVHPDRIIIESHAHGNFPQQYGFSVGEIEEVDSRRKRVRLLITAHEVQTTPDYEMGH